MKSLQKLFKIYKIKAFIKSLQKLSFRLSRTVVTENDPLGALIDNETDEIIQVQQSQPMTEEQLEKARIHEAMFSDQPVLFKGHRSATFENASNLNKGMHRSDTMPTQSITSSIASIGSSLKFGFRYEEILIFEVKLMDFC